ncbi:MAG: terminase small subunit [Leptolyngbya sp. UWPOB_LEPTO1]|uniref:terminase small subunit n=1 Tax=Leptolyngbya sp. UWPOB_LEPTO1 TaxID=2815653 RepID=UPI001ACD058B|nr:terminase small subunit [Leptolyngbya sp. UWPOB_LEPTO1]MBN8564529.1 terminase small subunit [Leptolyngbya sp. UWPOB_LEPTO1]
MARSRRSELTEQERRFADAYFVCLDVKQSLAAAAYTGNPEALRKAGYRLLTSDRVQAYLQNRREKVVSATDQTLNEILTQLKTIAFCNIKDVATWDAQGVHFKNSDQISDEKAQAIRRIKGRKRSLLGKDGEVTGETFDFEVELHNKEMALKTLATYYGIDSDWNSLIAGLARFGLVLKEDANQLSGWRVDRLEK